MKLSCVFIIFILNFSSNLLADDIFFYLDSAYTNNPKLNSERKNLEAIKQNLNISRSEFLPSISLSSERSDTQNTSSTNQAGSSLPDTSRNRTTNTFSIDQKIFDGFQNINNFKKSKLESEKAKTNLKKVEQEIILESVYAFYDLLYKKKNKEFYNKNVSLFERQVESDGSRMQKGEITLTDLAQSESSLAEAKAKFISAKTELSNAEADFERIIRTVPPKNISQKLNLKLNLPNNRNEVLKLSEQNHPKLLVAKLNYEISIRNFSIEKAKLSPSASINYSKVDNDDFSSTINKIEQEVVTGKVSWPIVKGGRNYASIKKSRFKKEQSKLIMQDTINDVKTNAINAWSVYESSEGILKATEAQLEAAEIANEGITLEYDSGSTRTTLDVIQSRSLLLSARISNAKARRDFIISQFKLLSSVGNLSLNYIKKSNN